MKNESHLLQVGHRLLIYRILTGQFPNYEPVLPRGNNKSMVLERTELTGDVRRASQHYEMAGYGCVRTYAKLLGESVAAKSEANLVKKQFPVLLVSIGATKTNFPHHAAPLCTLWTMKTIRCGTPDCDCVFPTDVSSKASLEACYARKGMGSLRKTQRSTG